MKDTNRTEPINKRRPTLCTGAIAAALLISGLTLPMEHAYGRPAQRLAQSFKPYQQTNKWLPTPDTPEFQPGPQSQSQQQSQKQDQDPDQIQPQQDQAQTSPFVVNPDGTPALNIIAPGDRPQIPPPPATPGLPDSGVTPSPSAAWRVKAFQLFKTTKFDAANQLSFTLAAPLPDAINGLRQAAEEEGLLVQGQAAAAGQMLITYSDSPDSRPEKAIIAMRPRNPGSTGGQLNRDLAKAQPIKNQTDRDSDRDMGHNQTQPFNQDDSSNNNYQWAQTDIRVQCENRNRTLTVTRLREILNRLSAGMGNARTRTETF